MHDRNREWEVEWEDGTIWFLSWLQDAGSFMAERWYPDDGPDGPYVGCPGPDDMLVESLETLESAMGRPIPPDVRMELLKIGECFPFTDEMRSSWTEYNAFSITRLHPSGEFVDTFAPPGAEEPFAIEWLPEWMA